jgi:predicted nuclease of predicted toxin-antitoxin system
MLRLAADENFDNDIVRGVLRRNPALDIVRIQDTSLASAEDPVILEWAAREGRVLLTHDVNTLIGFAHQRVRTGRGMPGIFVTRADAPLGRVIEDLLFLAQESLVGEWEGQVRYLPL